MFEEETEEQKLAKHISAMNDSVTVLGYLITQVKDADIEKRVKANYEHLEIMLNKLSLNDLEKQTYQQSIEAAKIYLRRINLISV